MDYNEIPLGRADHRQQRAAPFARELVPAAHLVKEAL